MKTIGCLFALIIFLSQTALATEDTNRKITQIISSAYLVRGDLDGADARLKKHLEEDPEDAAAWNLLGQVALKAGNNKAAVRYFSQAAKRADENLKRSYHLQLAQAYDAVGDQNLAKKTRVVALKFPDSNIANDEEVVSVEGNKVQSSTVGLQNSKNAFDFTLGAGIDTNIGYLPETGNLVTGVGSPESAFSVFGVSATRTQLTGLKVNSLSADLQWVAVANQDLKQRGLLSVAAKAETELIARPKPDFFYEYFASATGAFASQEGMSHRASIIQLGYRLGHATSARDYYLMFRLQGEDYPGLRGTIIDPSGSTGETGIGYRTQRGSFNYSIEFLAALNSANGANYRNRRLQFPFLLIHQLNKDFSYGLQALYSRENFEKTSLVEFRSENRLGLFMTYRLGAELNIGAQVESAMVDSNQPYFTYDRQSATVFFKYRI